MKHLLTTVLLSITFLTADANVIVQTFIHFGAASKGCKGFGICRAATKTSAGMMAATIIYDNTTPSRLQLIIDEASLSQMPPDVVAGIRAGRFVQEDNWELPADVATAMSLSGTYNVPKGTYTAAISSGKVTIMLSIARPVAAR